MMFGLINAAQVLDVDNGAALKALVERLRQIQELPEASSGRGERPGRAGSRCWNSYSRWWPACRIVS